MGARGVASASLTEAGASGSSSRSEELIFVRDMLSELNEISKRNKQDMLSYLIEMAQFEAAELVERMKPVLK